jgi:hypothetical protein
MTENKKNQFQQPGRVKVVKGSILTPEMAGLRFILSVNNLLGKPEGNPLLPIFEKKWPKVKQESRGWYATKTGSYRLGALNETALQSDIWLIHMLCQKEDLTVDAAALKTCLKEVCKKAKYERASIAVSTILTDLIPEMTNLLQSELVEQGVSVLFYEEPGV